MRSFRTALFVSLAAFGVIALVYADTPTVTKKPEVNTNSYHLYTSALRIDEAGVVKIPARYQWSVETSWSGIDLKGKDLPDTRVMLRLYDPDHNFTALTAQMDLNTAAKLHRELGEMIAKKSQNPDYQFRPQLYDPKLIPVKRIIGIDKNGTVIVEDVPTQADTTPTPNESSR